MRVAVVGFPNVGKSALINRLSGRAICQSASRPGVTRQLKWVRVADNIDLLDSPGVLPPSLRDQVGAPPARQRQRQRQRERKPPLAAQLAASHGTAAWGA